MAAGKGVPLTGQTLQAALKFRTDTTGAGYAIFWTKVGNDFVSTGSHAVGKASGFADASCAIKIPVASTSPLSTVQTTQEPIFVENVAGTPTFLRRELAFKHDVTQIVFAPFEDGIIEFGNMRDEAQWSSVPEAIVTPKGNLRQAFEEEGALYAMLWQLDGDALRVAATYENPRDVKRRQRIRGDGKSFTSASRDIVLPTNLPTGPVATALAGEETVVSFKSGESYSEAESMGRAALAYEFDVQAIKLVPVYGSGGVVTGLLEYGLSTTAQLNQVTLEATLQMQADGSGAGYAIYWKQEGNQAVATKTYVSSGYRAALDAAGRKLSFADVSTTTTWDVRDDSPVAEAMRTRTAVYVPQMGECATDQRAGVADEYLVKGAAIVPVLGGVIEYGQYSASAAWASKEAATEQTMPNEEIEAAFSSGASYVIYWKRNDRSNKYELASAYELPKNSLSKEKEAKDASFTKQSAKVELPTGGLFPVGLCGESASTIVVPNTQTYPNFKRRELANEWGVGKITCVPLETGVLEFGTVTKDKRETTIGSEFGEASREYRRSVFMHDQWVDHRSNQRFYKTMQSIGESGVLRARYNEIANVISVSVFLIVWNSLAGGAADLSGDKMAPLLPFLPVLSMPLSVFSLTAPSLGLLLVFRTNAAYGRWDNARRVWGDIINKCRSLVRQGNTFFTDDRYPGYGNFKDYRRRLAAEVSAFTRCLRCFLRGKEDEENLRVELKGLGFTPEEVAGYMGAANKQVYALQKMGETIRLYDMDGRDRANMDQLLSALCDDVGACERIFKTPIPLVYTRHTSRFVGTWLALLPFAIWGIDTSWNHLVTAPACALTVFFLLGIEELGLQIEEPFGILPIEAFCDGSIGAALDEMVLTEDKRRGQEHALAQAVSGPPAPAAFESVFGAGDKSDEGLAKAFASVDTDGSGKVSSDEMKACIAKMYGKTLPSKTVDNMIKAADTDGDGEVDFEEFKAIMRGGPAKVAPAPKPVATPAPKPVVAAAPKPVVAAAPAAVVVPTEPKKEVKYSWGPSAN